eukprot:4793281-Amphidinium_carterae.1
MFGGLGDTDSLFYLSNLAFLVRAGNPQYSKRHHPHQRDNDLKTHLLAKKRNKSNRCYDY